MAQELIDKIRAAAQARNVDPDLAVRIAQAESSLNPQARAKTSSAAGLFQVTDGTWKQFGGKPGGKLDADENIRVGLDIIASNTNALRSALGREPRPAEVYAAHYFGPAGAKSVLTAPTDQQIDQLLSKSAIKANANLKGKNVGEVLAQLESKVGTPNVSRETAPAARGRTPAEEVMEPALRSGMTAQAPSVPRGTTVAKADLSPSYQAALALSVLSDENEKEDRDPDRSPSIAEQWLAQQASRPAALADLGSTRIQSPFPTEKPVMLSDGGEVGEESREPDRPLLGDIPAKEALRLFKGAHKNSVGGRDVEGAMAGADLSLGDDTTLSFSGDVSRMSRGEQDRLAQAVRASLAQKIGEAEIRASMTKPLGEENRGVRMGDLSASYPVGEGRLSVSRQMLYSPWYTGGVGYSVGYGGKVGPGVLSGGINFPDQGKPSGQIQYRIPLGRADGGEVKEPSLFAVSDYSRSVAQDMYPGEQGQFDRQDAARHMLAAGSLARKYGPTAAEMLGKLHEITTSPGRWLGSKLGISEMPVDYEQDLHNNRIGIELARRSRSQKDLEDLIQQAAEAAKGSQMEGTAWIGRPQRPVKRAEGSPQRGEVAEPTPEELEKASKPAFLTPKSGIGRKSSATSGQINAAALQGIAETPYNLVGAPVDLITLGMRPFGYDEKAPVMGSEWIKEKMTKLGIRPEPPKEPGARAVYELTQAASGLANPAGVTRGAVRTAQKTGEAAKMLARDFQEYNQALSAPGASYAVKPKGGVFSYVPELADPYKSNSYLDDLVMDYVREADNVSDSGAKAALTEFLKTKAPKYFTTTYGTADDPLRTAIRTSRFDLQGREAAKMPMYMIDAAANPQARGHAQAAIDLERAYDELTGIQGMAFRGSDAPKFSERDRTMQINQAMAAEGVPIEARNPPSIDVYGVEDFSQYPHGTKAIRRLVESQDELPAHLRQALQTGETIYDVRPRFEMLSPENVVEALSQLPPNKLKNMSFPEALVQGMQAVAPLRDYKAAIDIAERGGAVPPAVLMKFTAPVTPTVSGQWVKLTEPIATKLEGKLMKHSVGGYAEGDSYGLAYTGLPYGGKKAFDEGLVEVYSLRDANGKPAVTVEVANKGAPDAPKWAVTQIRGRFNSEPSQKDRGAVFDLLDKLDQRGNLAEVRPNSYSVGPTGERLDQGNLVDWGREYEIWKSGFEE